MTHEQFHKLDEMEQAELVWEGVHIADRQDDKHKILLYKKDDLYIEVYYHLTHNAIKKFQAFSKEELLDIYTFKTGFGSN